MLAQLSHWSRTEIERIWQLGIIYVALSMALVQGASLITQFVLAGVFGPAEFAIVKVVENTLRLLLIPAMAGIPSALIKFIAEDNDERRQSHLLGQGLALSAIISITIALIIFGAAPLIFNEPQTSRYVRILAWTLVFTSIVRTVIAYFQGRKQMKRLSLYNAGTVLISLTLSIGGGIIWGLNGWAIGRFSGELISAIIVLLPVRKILTFVWESAQILQLVTFGGLAFISLLLDRAVQMSDVIILARNGFPPPVIGVYGLATTVLVALTLPVGATMMAAFPLIAEQVTVRAAWNVTRNILWRVVLLSVAIAIVAYFAVPWLIEVIWGQPYQGSSLYFQVLLVLFVVNGILTVLGTFVFGIGKPLYSVIANTFGFLMFFGLSSFMVENYQVYGLILLLILVSVLRMVIFAILIARNMAKQPLNSV